MCYNLIVVLGIIMGDMLKVIFYFFKLCIALCPLIFEQAIYNIDQGVAANKLMIKSTVGWIKGGLFFGNN
jgi:hypothetical protein